MNQGFTVKMNKAKLKTLREAQLAALELTGEQLLADKIEAAQIPFQEGTMQNIQTYINDKAISQGKLQIVHDTPYAARLYYNPQFDFDQTFNWNAQGEWWEEELNDESIATDIYKMLYKRITGGIVQ